MESKLTKEEALALASIVERLVDCELTETEEDFDEEFLYLCIAHLKRLYAIAGKLPTHEKKKERVLAIIREIKAESK